MIFNFEILSLYWSIFHIFHSKMNGNYNGVSDLNPGSNVRGSLIISFNAIIRPIPWVFNHSKWLVHSVFKRLLFPLSIHFYMKEMQPYNYRDQSAQVFHHMDSSIRHTRLTSFCYASVSCSASGNPRLKSVSWERKYERSISRKSFCTQTRRDWKLRLHEKS